MPPQYNSVIGIGGQGGYPPPKDAPPAYTSAVAYNHDFRAVDGVKAPQVVFNGESGSQLFEVTRFGVSLLGSDRASFGDRVVTSYTVC